MFTKKVKSIIKRCVFTSIALMSAAPAAALTGPAAFGIGVGATAVGGLALYGILKQHDKKEESSIHNKQHNKQHSKKTHSVSDSSKNKKFKDDPIKVESSSENAKNINKKATSSKGSKIETSDHTKKLEKAKTDLNKHKKQFDSLRNDGKEDTPKAKKHTSEISRLEKFIENLEQKGENEFKRIF